jgi:hypothetical protein
MLYQLITIKEDQRFDTSGKNNNNEYFNICKCIGHNTTQNQIKIKDLQIGLKVQTTKIFFGQIYQRNLEGNIHFDLYMVANFNLQTNWDGLLIIEHDTMESHTTLPKLANRPKVQPLVKIFENDGK